MSTYRKVWAWTDGPVTATVGRSAEWDEFRVRLSVNGQALPDADYFTSDKSDAMISAKAMVRQTMENAA